MASTLKDAFSDDNRPLKYSDKDHFRYLVLIKTQPKTRASFTYTIVVFKKRDIPYIVNMLYANKMYYKEKTW